MSGLKVGTAAALKHYLEERLDELARAVSDPDELAKRNLSFLTLDVRTAVQALYALEELTREREDDAC